MYKVLEGVRVQGSRKVVYKVRVRSCTRSAYKVLYKVISTRRQSEHAYKVVYKASVLVHQLKGFLQTAIWGPSGTGPVPGPSVLVLKVQQFGVM